MVHGFLKAKPFRYGLFLAISFSGASSFAASSGEALDFTIHEPYVHIRALGMGGAFTAVADDYGALYYNPAGLARLEDWQMNFEVRAMVDTDVLEFQKDIKSVKGSTASEDEELAKYKEILDKNYGKHMSARLPTLGWHWVKPRWGVSIVPVDLSLDMEIHNLGASPAASVVAYQDTTVAIGYARSPKWFKKHKISVGGTLKAVYRGYFNKQVLATDLAVDDEILRPEEADEGLFVDADLGLLFTPEISSRGFLGFFRFLRPTFGLVVKNVVDAPPVSNFHFIDDATGDAPTLQRRLDVGTMFELPDWWVFKSRFAFDVRDIGHDQWTFKKGMHAGVEFLWKMYGWWQGGWRAGINQGYWTAGFTGKLGFFQLDVASYGEEVGSSETSKESRRYMLKASLDF